MGEISPFSTTFKKLNPKKGFTAPYIRFAWNTRHALIGKPVTIYKVEGGFFVSVESNEFKPFNLKKVESDISKIRNNEFKLTEIENTTHSMVKTKKECPRPDLNRRQLDLQSSALPS